MYRPTLGLSRLTRLVIAGLFGAVWTCVAHAEPTAVGAATPASACFRIASIWLSVNLDFFI